MNSLAKALRVEPEVLTGKLPLPESDKTPELERVQIGAQVAPKVRLAYDLIKRRYGVSTTEMITMGPLFFALLAQGSLAWRREKLKEVEEMGSAETYPEGVSEEEFWKEGLKESHKRYKLWRELSRLEEKHREELSRLEMLITEEKDRSTSLNDTDPEGDLTGKEEADSQETNSDIEKGGDDQ